MFCIHLHIFMWHLEPSSSLWDGVHIDVCLAPVTSYSTALWMQPGRADFWIHQSKRMWCLNDNSWLSDPGINIIMFHMWGSTFTKKKNESRCGVTSKEAGPYWWDAKGSRKSHTWQRSPPSLSTRSCPVSHCSVASNSFIWRECDSVEEALCSAAAPGGGGECPEGAEAILTSTKLLQECEMCDLVLVHETLTL